MERARSQRRASLETKEYDLLTVQWGLAQDYVDKGTDYLASGNKEKALQLCEKALSLLPAFLPAQSLLRKIKGHPNEHFDADCGYDADVSSINTLSDDENSRVGRESNNMLERTFVETRHNSKLKPVNVGPSQSSRYDAPTPVKGILKKYPSMGDLNSNNLHHQSNTDQVEVKVSQTKPMEWEKMRTTLLAAHVGQITTIDFLLLMKELWDSESKVYVCPYGTCSRTYDHRLHSIQHVLLRHFSSHDNVELRPFFCRTCKTRYRTLEELIQHGIAHHPKCKWLPQLQERIYDPSE